MTSRAQTGFSLLEVLVAFTILALVVGMVFEVLSGGARNLFHAEKVVRAAMYADSLLERVGQDEPLKEGTSNGKFAESEYKWQLQIAPEPEEKPSNGVDIKAVLPVQLYRVVLSVSWDESGKTRQVSRTTLRLGAKP